MFLKRLLVLIVVAFTTTSVGLSQETLKIQGRVLDDNGSVIAGAQVEISKKELRFKREATTASGGEFAFENLPTGEYEVIVTAKNFGSVTRNFQVSKSSETLEIVLKPEQVAAEVNVSASYLAGTEGSLSETPGSIERVSPQELEAARVFNFSEALRKVSGVNVRDEEGFGLRPNIGIRGTNPTRSTKILLLEDGLPLAYAPYGDNASYYHPPIERYESIEVLKGSGQIAYGPQTVAGVVNYLTPNPPATRTFGIKAVGGNRRFFDGDLSYGDTIGRLGFFLNYNRKQGEGARENTFSILNDFFSKATFAINERHQINSKFSFYGENSNVAYSGLTEAEYQANPRQNPFKNDRFYGRRYGFTLGHTGVLSSNVSINSNFYANYFSRDWWRQSSNSGQRPNRLNVDPDCRGMQDLLTTCGNEGRLRDYFVLGFEPRLTAIFDLGSLRNELNIGFRIHREDQDRLQKNGDLPASRDGVLAENNERQALAYSGFVQHRFIWRDLAFTPGVRVEKIKYQRTNRLASNGGATGKTELTEIVPGFGVAYSGLKRTTFFAGVHRGFAPPRVEDVVTNAGGVIELDSELSWNTEIGVRTRPFQGINLGATFFRNDFENQIIPATLAGGATLTNGGKTLHQGFEANAQIDGGMIFASPHNVYFRAAYTYLPVAEFRGERFSTVSGFGGTRITGNRLPYAPENTLTTALGYSHPIGFDAFIENVYIGRQFSDDLNTVNPTANGQRGAIQAQTYWNATANYRVERWRTTFFVTAKNIFDRTFVVDRSRGLLPSSPRLVQTGVKINF